MRMIQNSYAMVCPPVREIINSLKLLDYLLIQADKPWYNNYLSDRYLMQQLRSDNDTNTYGLIIDCFQTNEFFELLK